jgi:ribosomal protein S16
MVNVKQELLSLWLSRGATPTDTVASLLKRQGAAAAAAQ